jgi:hypothetical protein
MFLVYTGPIEGGCDGKLNDCLYDCLVEALGVIRFPKKLNEPGVFKKHFGYFLRKAKIELEHVDEIEDLLKVSINLYGDHPRPRTNKYVETIDLNLIDGHYSLKTDDLEMKRKMFLVTYKFENKPIVAYTFNKVDQLYHFYENYPKKMNYSMTQGEFWNVNLYEKLHIYCEPDVSLPDFLSQYKKDVELLYQASKGKLNMRRCIQPRSISLKLFYDHNKHKNIAEPIDQLEAEWLKIHGGLMYCRPGTYDQVYSYDINSFYPFIMTTSNLVPIKRGEFKILDVLDHNNLEVGIYRLNVERNSHLPVLRLHEDNRYTHFDIQNMVKQGAKFELIQDNTPNCLIYSKDKCVSIASLFKPIVDYLYPMKQAKVPFVKEILNNMWGALCQRKTKTEKVHEERYDIKNEYDITSIKVLDVDSDDKLLNLKIKMMNKVDTFRTPYARIGAFITSMGRYMMTCKVLPIQDKIIRVHTDGFYSTQIIDKYANSTQIGQFKLDDTLKDGEVLEIKNMLNTIDSLRK